MLTTTLTIPSIDTEILPDLDPAVGHQLGDEIVLSAVRLTKVAKVHAGQARSESRAWSFGGNVD